MGTRDKVGAATLVGVALLLVGGLVSPLGAAPVTTTTADPGPPPTTTTTRPTTTTTRATTSTSAATTSTTAAPATTSAPTTTPTTIRSADEFSEQDEDESTTTSEAPPPSIVKPAPPSVDIVAGETVQVPVETDDVFDPDVDPEVTLSTSGDDATTVQAIVSASVDEDGNLVIEVEVPEDTPESIITVTITAVDTRGVSRTIVYLFPVRPAPSTSTTGEEQRRPAAVGGAGASNGIRWSDLPVVPDAEVPAVVKAIQASIPDEATEQALLAELAAEPESVLYLDDVTYAVSVRPLDEAQGTARGLIAAVAMAVAGTGLITLRRRTLSAQIEESR